MTKKMGRNDPCPCGSGKKYKNCCGAAAGSKRRFEASVISSGLSSGTSLGGRASKISTAFFSQPLPGPKKIEEEPRQPEENEPHHPPEADKPM